MYWERCLKCNSKNIKNIDPHVTVCIECGTQVSESCCD